MANLWPVFKGNNVITVVRKRSLYAKKTFIDDDADDEYADDEDDDDSDDCDTEDDIIPTEKGVSDGDIIDLRSSPILHLHNKASPSIVNDSSNRITEKVVNVDEKRIPTPEETLVAIDDDDDDDDDNQSMGNGINDGDIIDLRCSPVDSLLDKPSTSAANQCTLLLKVDLVDESPSPAKTVEDDDNQSKSGKEVIDLRNSPVDSLLYSPSTITTIVLNKYTDEDKKVCDNATSSLTLSSPSPRPVSRLGTIDLYQVPNKEPSAVASFSDPLIIDLDEEPRNPDVITVE